MLKTIIKTMPFSFLFFPFLLSSRISLSSAFAGESILCIQPLPILLNSKGGPEKILTMNKKYSKNLALRL